jgi:hypothetical protein
VLDVVADAGERVAGEVERWGGAAVVGAEAGEEGDEDGVVGAGVAGLPQRSLVLVPAPEHGDVAWTRGGEGAHGKQGDEEEGRWDEEDAPPGRHRRGCGGAVVPVATRGLIYTR